MKSCIYCGNPLEDHAQFCNICGQNQYQNQQPQAPYGQVPQYQQPPYQAPRYQPPYAQSQYAPASTLPYKPPMWIIGLFNLLGAIVAMMTTSIVNTVAMTIGLATGSTVVSLLLGGFSDVVYVLMTCIGFVIYNNGCRRNHHPEKKLAIFWVGIHWLLRTIFGFVLGTLWGLAIPFLYYESGLPMATVGVVSLVASWCIALVNAGITWLISGLILKSVVKNR